MKSNISPSIESKTKTKTSQVISSKTSNLVSNNTLLISNENEKKSTTSTISPRNNNNNFSKDFFKSDLKRKKNQLSDTIFSNSSTKSVPSSHSKYPFETSSSRSNMYSTSMLIEDTVRNSKRPRGRPPVSKHDSFTDIENISSINKSHTQVTFGSDIIHPLTTNEPHVDVSTNIPKSPTLTSGTSKSITFSPKALKTSISSSSKDNIAINVASTNVRGSSQKKHDESLNTTKNTTSVSNVDSNPPNAPNASNNEVNKLHRVPASIITERVLAKLMTDEPNSVLDLLKHYPDMSKDATQSVIDILQVFGILVPLKKISSSNTNIFYSLPNFIKGIDSFPLSTISDEIKKRKESVENIKSRIHVLQVY